MLIFLGVAALGLLAYLATAGQQDEARTLREWEMILSPECSRLYDEVSQQILLDHRMVGELYTDAAGARVEGREQAMVNFLQVGARLVGDCSGSLRALLRNVSILSRHAAAIAPMSPLRPAAFRVGVLFTLAGCHQVAHHFLVTTRERLHLRIAVLRCGVVAATHLLRRATRRTAASPTDDLRWGRMEIVRADLGTLTEESLATLRFTLASLAAVPRPVESAARKPARPAI
jgi:hypothetical protein